MYKSEYTYFTAYNKPLVNTIYVKNENITTAIIDIDDNWNMHGSVMHLQLCPIGDGSKFILNQKDCERILLKNTPPPCRKDMLRQYGLDKYDSAEIMYRTRGINLLDKFWLAWSKDDKAEDYHPLCNPELMKQRIENMLHLELEEDEEPFPAIGSESEACRFTRLNIEKYVREQEEKRLKQIEQEWDFSNIDY